MPLNSNALTVCFNIDLGYVFYWKTPRLVYLSIPFSMLFVFPLSTFSLIRFGIVQHILFYRSDIFGVHVVWTKYLPF